MLLSMKKLLIFMSLSFTLLLASSTTIESLSTYPPSRYFSESSPFSLRISKEIFLDRYFSVWSKQESPKIPLFFYGVKMVFEGGWNTQKNLYTSEESEKMVYNADIEHYPSLNIPAIILQETAIRALPTNQPLFGNPSKPAEGYPFDYFQLSQVHPSTPAKIWHTSRDKEWFYIETPSVSGWIHSRFIAKLDQHTTKILKKLPLKTPQSDKGQLLLDNNSTLSFRIGTLLFQGEDNTLLVPQKNNNGFAIFHSATTQESLFSFPLPGSTIKILADQLNQQIYGWGGIDQKRDCSSLTQDIFLPLGIFLPRNSADQAQENYGEYVSLENLSSEQKKHLLHTRAKPWKTLLFMKGHVMLYLGEYKNEFLIFHNLWGIRLFQSTKESRYVVGKTLVSTLEIGKEFPTWHPQKSSLLYQIKGMRIFP